MMSHQGIGQSGSALASWAFDRHPVHHAKNIAAKVVMTSDDVSKTKGIPVNGDGDDDDADDDNNDNDNDNDVIVNQVGCSIEPGQTHDDLVDCLR